jgi:hypothetical protein
MRTQDRTLNGFAVCFNRLVVPNRDYQGVAASPLAPLGTLLSWAIRKHRSTHLSLTKAHGMAIEVKYQRICTKLDNFLCQWVHSPMTSITIIANCQWIEFQGQHVMHPAPAHGVSKQRNYLCTNTTRVLGPVAHQALRPQFIPHCWKKGQKQPSSRPLDQVPARFPSVRFCYPCPCHPLVRSPTLLRVSPCIEKYLRIDEIADSGSCPFINAPRLTISAICSTELDPLFHTSLFFSPHLWASLSSCWDDLQY